MGAKLRLRQGAERRAEALRHVHVGATGAARHRAGSWHVQHLAVQLLSSRQEDADRRRSFARSQGAQWGCVGAHLMVRLMAAGVNRECIAARSARGMVVLSGMPLEALPEEPLLIFWLAPLDLRPSTAGAGYWEPGPAAWAHACGAGSPCQGEVRRMQ